MFRSVNAVRLAILSIGSSVAGGCAPALTLQPTPRVVAVEWSAELTDGGRTFAARRDLGSEIGSTELTALIDAARAANADIRIAAARVDQARASLRIARGSMLPTVSASAGLGAARTDRPADPFDFADAFAGLDVAYEVDLFGGAAAGRRSGRERVLAAAFDRAAILIAVEAELTRAFVQRAALSDRIALLDRSIEQARELERIIRARLNAGDATRVDLGLQTIQVRQLETERSRLTQSLDRTRTAMAVLAGREAPLFTSVPTRLTALTVPAFDPGSPGDLLTARPDVRAAEARIGAAGGDVVQARAAFLPRLRLSAAALVQAAGPSGPIGTVLSIGGDLLAPIFDRGRLRGGYDLATATQRESVERYRQTLLTALAEVEDAMSAMERSREREATILGIVEEARLTARLARLRYLGGESDLRDVLDAEQLLVEAEDARAIVLQQRIEAAVDLFRATGGRL